MNIKSELFKEIKRQSEEKLGRKLTDAEQVSTIKDLQEQLFMIDLDVNVRKYKDKITINSYVTVNEHFKSKIGLLND